MLIRTNPLLFKGMLRIRVGHILDVMLCEFSRVLSLKGKYIVKLKLKRR